MAKHKWLDPTLLLQMRDEMDTLGGVGVIAKRSGLSRTCVNRALSVKGNPRYRTFFKLIYALGLNERLTVVVTHKAKFARRVAND